MAGNAGTLSWPSQARIAKVATGSWKFRTKHNARPGREDVLRRAEAPLSRCPRRKTTAPFTRRRRSSAPRPRTNRATMANRRQRPKILSALRAATASLRHSPCCVSSLSNRPHLDLASAAIDNCREPLARLQVHTTNVEPHSPPRKTPGEHLLQFVEGRIRLLVM